MSASSEPPSQAEEPPEELVISLKKPLEGPTGPITAITLREPTAAQVMLWDKLEDWEANVMAVSVVAGIPNAVAAKMAASQLLQGARYIGRFLR